MTLYKNDYTSPPHPGASPEPTPDPTAPTKKGCRVEINYRTKDLEPAHGEAIVFAATYRADIDALFRSACVNTPEQFVGIVSPEVAPRYEIILRHWELGEARFVFSCGRPQKLTKNIEVFRRRCKVTGNVEGLPSGIREEAARRLTPLKGRLKERVPQFFRRKRRFFC